MADKEVIERTLEKYEKEAEEKRDTIAAQTAELEQVKDELRNAQMLVSENQNRVEVLTAQIESNQNRADHLAINTIPFLQEQLTATEDSENTENDSNTSK